MRKGFDVIVVGVGAMGAAACFQLASRGVKVLGLEQFDVPNARGSSHGVTRMIRKAYYEHPGYVPLIQRVYALWDELEAVSGRKLLFRVGGLYMGPGEGMFVGGSRQAAEEHALAHEMLSVEEVRKRWPQFVVPEGWAALFETEAGFLLPEKVIAAYAEWAMRRGAEIHGNEAVREWKADGRGVWVRTDRGEYEGDRLIFCGGAWSGKLVAELGVKLRVTRQVMGWVWPKVPGDFEMGRVPAWGIDSLDGGICYGFPMIAEGVGMKVAHHLAGREIDPDVDRHEARMEDEEGFRPALRKHLPGADGALVGMRVCMYTNSPDGHFIVDRLPGVERVQVACGFSGHGFKFASVIGEILAEGAMGRAVRGAEFLQLNRFA